MMPPIAQNISSFSNLTSHAVNSSTWQTINILNLIFISPLLLISLIGNIAVILTKIRRPSNCNSDILVPIKAICDLVKTVSFVLIYMTPKFEGRWLWYAFTCSFLQKLLLGVFSTTASLTVLLTYDRYQIITRPFGGGMTPWKFRAIICITLILNGAGFSNGYMFLFHIRDDTVLRCVAVGFENRNREWFIFEMALVTTKTILFSIAMSIMLSKSTKELLREKGRRKESAVKRNRFRENESAVFVLRSIYIAYVTSFVPWMCLYVTESVYPQRVIDFEAHPGSIVFYWFIAGSFCNAFLTYVVFSSQFRTNLCKSCKCYVSVSP